MTMKRYEVPILVEKDQLWIQFPRWKKYQTLSLLINLAKSLRPLKMIWFSQLTQQNLAIKRINFISK